VRKTARDNAIHLVDGDRLFLGALQVIFVLSARSAMTLPGMASSRKRGASPRDGEPILVSMSVAEEGRKPGCWLIKRYPRILVNQEPIECEIDKAAHRDGAMLDSPAQSQTSQQPRTRMARPHRIEGQLSSLHLTSSALEVMLPRADEDRIITRNIISKRQPSTTKRCWHG
jgi:hypothetical protein